MLFQMLHLSLYVLTVIQMTSSQSTYDVSQQDNDVNSCGRTEHVLSELVTVVSQLQRNDVQNSANTDHVLHQLITMTYQLHVTVLQLQRDVVEMKAVIAHKDASGMSRIGQVKVNT